MHLCSLFRIVCSLFRIFVFRLLNYTVLYTSESKMSLSDHKDVQDYLGHCSLHLAYWNFLHGADYMVMDNKTISNCIRTQQSPEY